MKYQGDREIGKGYRLKHNFNSGKGPILHIHWTVKVEPGDDPSRPEIQKLVLLFQHQWSGEGQALGPEMRALIDGLAEDGLTEVAEYVRVVVA